MSYNLKRSVFTVLVSILATNGFSQVEKPRQVALPMKVAKDTVPAVKTSPARVITAQPVATQPVKTQPLATQPVTKMEQPSASTVTVHAKLVKNAKNGVMIQSLPMAVYGNNAVLRNQRITQFANSFTEPAFTKNINGINIRYQLRKNPNYDAPPTASVQGSSGSSEGNFNCTTTRESVNARSASFLSVSADGAGIYPGAIYKYDDFYNGNTLKSYGDGQRNPIVIYTSNVTNSTGDVAVTVSNPTAGNITDATKPITRNFSTTTTSGSSIGQYTYSNNTASMALNLSAGGAYSGFSAAAGFQINKQDKHIYITCDYKIPLYSLSTEIPANGFFSNPSLESTQNLLLISSVMYGTRILANIDIDETGLSDSVFATFQYGDPSKAGAKAAFDYLQRSKNSKITINTYVVGMAAGMTPHPTSIDEFLSQIDAVIRNTTYQTAKPIGYTLTDMAGNTIGVESATDVYTVKNCVPKDAVYTLSGAEVMITSGNDGKDNGSNVNVTVYSNGLNTAAVQNANTEFKPGNNITMNLDIKQNGGIKLSDFMAGINRLDVFLEPKQVFLGWDAWDIQNIKLTLYFQDQNGTPYPRPIEIPMNNSGVRLEKNRQRVTCYFNGQFKSTTTMQP